MPTNAMGRFEASVLDNRFMIANKADVLRHLKAADERHANRIAFKIGDGPTSLEFAPSYVRVTHDLDVANESYAAFGDLCLDLLPDSDHPRLHVLAANQRPRTTGRHEEATETSIKQADALSMKEHIALSQKGS